MRLISVALELRMGLLLSWTAIDAAIAVYLRLNGANVISTVLLLAGVVGFGTAAISGRRAGLDIQKPSLVLLAAHLALATVVPYRAEGPPPPDLYRLLPLAALGALMAAWLWRKGSPGQSWALSAALWVTVGWGLVYRAAIVVTDTLPPFDVPRIQEAAGQALLHGADPYLTHVFRGGFPYLPIAAVAAAIGEVLGDARWASCLGDLMAVTGIVLFARRAGAGHHLGLILAALWTWWSGGFYVTWQGFPEPILIGFMALAGAALAGRRPRGLIGGILIGLAFGTKQFGAGLLPFIPWRSGPWRWTLIAAGGATLLVVAPIALWHPVQFAEGVFFSHLREPGRPYALNLLNWPGLTLELPLVLVFPLGIAFGWLTQRHVDAPVQRWLAGSGGLLLAAFALNRIAFVNYYAVPLALILLLILSVSGPHDDIGAEGGAGVSLRSAAT